ncbi:QsdR family transcriptional regulator [Subtercola boreus]|uniref:QsdR TetR regulatory C-terminal domain-containing protein n=1 Tax=Subtercola boreus TaxID=120213 RepID=A0A3E0WCR3_9MICO|nr:QsdR family transcriptional regulator [Subtercola boreus]RFA21145.1 hypothetical protein B7R24_07070 [Subtercola boreus]RFA21528.1 hypothetical protein B7R23_07015 [Subtercola boreus]RFA27498.1 hypothetical protein B7R25_07140 [Subtercola boreus]
MTSEEALGILHGRAPGVPRSSLGEVGTALVPTALSRRIAEGAASHADAQRAFVAARRLFIAGERIDMGELAAGLGVERTSLFRWVGNRDALLSEVLWSLAVPTFDQSDSAAANQSGAERICTLLSIFVDDLIVADYFRVFLRREPARALRLLTTTGSEVQRRFLAVVETLVREERTAGHTAFALPDHDLAYLLVRIAESFTYADLINDETPSAERARAAFEFILRD